MEFKCERTSDLFGDEPPCKEAVMVDSGKYVIEINNLEQLMDFVNNYGQVVITPVDDYNEKPVLEIYDYYRE